MEKRVSYKSDNGMLSENSTLRFYTNSAVATLHRVAQLRNSPFDLFCTALKNRHIANKNSTDRISSI